MPTSTGNIDVYKVSVFDLVGNMYNITKISIWEKDKEKVVYSAGNTVTYHVDTNIVYQEEVDADETVLSPKTFTPSKSGWEFVGWKQDAVANADVLDNLIMGDDPITLYAVFRQAVALTYYVSSAVANTLTNQKYYNNGHIVNPTFTVADPSLNGWVFRGWTTSTAANGELSYVSINNATLSNNLTLYATYYQTINLSYNGNGNTSGSTAMQYGYRFYSGNNTYVNPVFTVSANGFAKTGYSFVRWHLNGTSGAAYSPNSTITLTANATMYAEWTYVGAPFYIVEFYYCRYALNWTGTANYNWAVGQQYSGFPLNSSGKLRTQNIPTQGNKTFYINENYNVAAKGIITVSVYNAANNALLGSSQWNNPLTVDISKASSIYIQVTADEDTGFQPSTIRLY